VGGVTMTDSRYRIAEVAKRTGFSTPTLRYYEDIGLLPPAERTAAGYRLYDDRDVERLNFIARAKQLGCTLDEITQAWARNECAPIKHRLRAVVAAKLAETEARVAELTTFAAELRATATVLESAPLDGPCDDTCGCVRGPNGPVSIALSAKATARCWPTAGPSKAPASSASAWPRARPAARRP
jgi:DNA-binding transcriptional MerR regulator